VATPLHSTAWSGDGMMPHSWDPTRPTMRQPPPTSTADEPQAYRFLVAAVVA
jgi:hypothetical protein